jgi:hypothetical protein
MKFLPLFTALVLPLAAVDSVVTFNEIHYNPKGTTESGEWIEVHNQMSINVDLSGWKLTGGVDFVFPERTTIPGGGYYLIEKDPTNPALAGFNVTGPFEGSLSNNGGELITLLNNIGGIVQSFTYDDSTPWPKQTDGDDFSLVLLNPADLPDHKLATSWRASSHPGGNPGTSDICPAFAGDINADSDHDGIPALIEHFLGTSDGASDNTRNVFQVGSISDGGQTHPTFEVTYKVGTDDVQTSAYRSPNLQSWSNTPDDIVVQSHTFNGDGTATIIWRSTETIFETPRQFFQLRATTP